jgi:hypothetical protein
VETRTLKPSRRKWVLVLCICVLFTAGGALLASAGELWGWVALVFFGLGIPVSALVLAGRINGLRLAPEGFTIRSLRSSTFAWDDVEEFGTFETRGGTMVGFRFVATNDKAWLGRSLAYQMSKYEGALPDTYGMKPEELVALMESWRARYARGERSGSTAAPRA